MSKTIRASAFSIAALCLAGAALAQPVSYGAPITLETAKKAAAAASAEARRNSFTMAIAVVDSGGALVYFEKIDGTQIASIDVALGKARSANAYKRPTKAFEDAVAGGRNAVLGLPHALPIEGGVPLLADGRIVGAIGVSGGSAQQDGQVATAGAAALQAK